MNIVTYIIRKEKTAISFADTLRLCTREMGEFGCLTILALLPKQFWISRSSIYELTKAILFSHHDVKMSEVDFFVREAERLVDILEVKNCPISIPQRDCIVLRLIPRYHRLVRRDLTRIAKTRGCNWRHLKAVLDSKRIRRFFERNFHSCPVPSCKCLRGRAVTSISTQPIDKYYSIGDIKGDIKKGRLSLLNAARFLPLKTQMILSVLVSMPRGYYSIGLQRLKQEVQWAYKLDVDDKEIETACEPLEELEYIHKSSRRGMKTYSLPSRSVNCPNRKLMSEALKAQQDARDLIEVLRVASNHVFSEEFEA